MPVPQVAIVGRPNVGKSSLFNWLAGRRIAIVDPTPGVTRDRLGTLVEVNDRYFELVDTGGMGHEDVDQLTEDVELQIQQAIDRASLLLFVVDVRTGPTPLDQEVAQRLRQVSCPIVLIANKCDHDGLESQAVEFHELGFGDVHCVSAHQNRGKQELIDLILSLVPTEVDAEPETAEEVKIAIVGRRNTGKSTFINCLAGEPRTIVSEVPGTTRDSVDVRIERDGKTIIAIDTAGVRHKGSMQTDIEFYSLHRAERSIRRADVVLHFFDATQTISHVDKQLAGYILENYKPAIFVLNKWDLVKEKADIPTGDFGDYLHKVFPNLDHVPIAFITAKDGKNVERLVNLAINLFKQSKTRVTTGDLNRVVQRAITEQAPPTRMNRLPKIYYATQVGTQPPTIVLITNGPELYDPTYLRYLMKAFRDHLPFQDVAIKMYLRSRNRDNKETPTPESKPKPKPKKKKPPKPEKTGELWQDL